MGSDDRDVQRPLLRVVKGDPTPEELAALVAVVTARGSAAGAGEPPHFSLWARKARQIRPPLRPGFGAWRASMMPR